MPIKSDYTSITSDIHAAMSDLPTDELCELRNRLVPGEYAHPDAEGGIQIHTFAEIEAWVKRVGLAFTENDDFECFEPNVKFWINDEGSDELFNDTFEATLAAYTQLQINGEWDQFGMFMCEGACGQAHDTEEMIDRDGCKFCHACACQCTNA